jgi:hypothetical protein
VANSELFLFVSHVAENRDAAMEIVDELERRGTRCWIAPRDVQPGEAFDNEIADAIEASRAMLLIFSDLCNDSEYIRREVTVAGESHKTVIPFRIEDVQPRRGLRVRLSDLHWIDGFTSRERAIDELIKKFATSTNGPVAPPLNDGGQQNTPKVQTEPKTADTIGQAQPIVQATPDVPPKEPITPPAKPKPALEVESKAEAERKAKAEAEARQQAETDARRKTEQDRAAAVAPAVAAMNILPAATSQPVRSASPRTSQALIFSLGALLATGLLVDPPVFHLMDRHYDNEGYLIGLVPGVINCILGASLIFLRQRFRWLVWGLCLLGLLANGAYSLLILEPDSPGQNFVPAARVSMFYFVVCLVTVAVLWLTRSSLAPAKNQDAPAGERLQA